MHSDRPDYLTDKVTLFLAGEHPCSYLPGKLSQEVYAQPLTRFNNHIYSQLIYSGFRRSGELVYRPHCKACSACIPVRVPVRDFKPTRAQRRTLKKNGALTAKSFAPEFNEEHFALYEKYVNQRHPNGGMDHPEPREYMEMLTSHWTQTEFVEFRENGRLVAIAVMDKLEDGYSAVYTYWDTADRLQSLGTYAILWQIEHAAQSGFQYLYLGYWIEECRKMRYKNQFRPLEQYFNNRWDLLVDS